MMNMRESRLLDFYVQGSHNQSLVNLHTTNHFIPDMSKSISSPFFLSFWPAVSRKVVYCRSPRLCVISRLVIACYYFCTSTVFVCR